MSFDKCVSPCNKHPNQGIEHSHHPEKFFWVQFQSISVLSSGNHYSDFQLHTLILPVLKLHVNEVILYVEIFFLYLLTIHKSSFVKHLLKSFVFLKKLAVCFLKLFYSSPLYILDTSPLLKIHMAKFFFRICLTFLFSQYYLLMNRSFKF